MTFRKDINGLRAFAVIAVVLFHFNSSWMPGGFAGVDVFFVISGFLMTGIIFKGLENNNFSVLNFYVARANRIIPALAALCIALLVFGWFYLTPIEYKALGKHAASSVTFLSNIAYWKEAGYFEAASHEKWLLHTWSLSVEWQFYILYPLILIMLKKLFSLKAIKPLIIVSTVIGFIFSFYATYRWPGASYYLFPMRAWEMLLGGIAFLYPLNIKGGYKKIIEALGLVLIVSSYVFISGNDPWPGYLALFPVLGTFLVIQAQRNDSVITGNIVFQKIGAWSYSIYLWHWPFVVAIYIFSLPSYFIYLGIGLSILLGYLSYKYIERIKFPRSFPNLVSYLQCKPIYYALGVTFLSSIIFLSNGAKLDYRAGASSEKSKFLDYYAEQYENNRAEDYWLKCNPYGAFKESGSYEIDSICIKDKGDGGIFLWGDSHAEGLSLGIRQLAENNHIPFYQVTGAGCKPSFEDVVDMKGEFKEACNQTNKLAIKSIKSLQPKLIIIAQRNEHDKTDWNHIARQLSLISNSKILLVGPISQWHPSLPQVMIKPKHWKKGDSYISDEGLDVSIIETDINMRKIEPTNNLEYISQIDKLCVKDNGEIKCRVTDNNNNLLQLDYGHLSREGSKFVVSQVLADKILSMYHTN